MASSKVDDPEFNWWTRVVGSVSGAVAGVYTEPTLSTSYTSGATAGTVLYVKIGQSLVRSIRVGHQVLLRVSDDYRVDVVAKVVDRVENGANSYIACKLLEADDNSPSNDLSDCDTLLVIGNVNPEGGQAPEAVAFNPTKVYNYTQIFKTPLEVTRTANLTRLRTGDYYKRTKREALEQHSIEMELAFLWGIRTENTGTNGKPERTTMGLINFIRTYSSGNVSDYTLASDYSGMTWAQGGELWLDAMFERIFRYGASEKLALCGSGALLGINALAKASGHINLTPTSTSYGIKVVQWITPFGVVNLKTHPLFSYDATTRNMMVIFEPKDLVFRYITDTKFEDVTPPGIDGVKEQYITEAGLEFHFPEKCGVLNGVGLKNTLTP